MAPVPRIVALIRVLPVVVDYPLDSIRDDLTCGRRPAESAFRALEAHGVGRLDWPRPLSWPRLALLAGLPRPG
ncbi:hypothetical protein GCM10027059_42890 [Myceligenerans halotolerans]